MELQKEWGICCIVETRLQPVNVVSTNSVNYVVFVRLSVRLFIRKQVLRIWKPRWSCWVRMKWQWLLAMYQYRVLIWIFMAKIIWCWLFMMWQNWKMCKGYWPLKKNIPSLPRNWNLPSLLIWVTKFVHRSMLLSDFPVWWYRLPAKRKEKCMLILSQRIMNDCCAWWMIFSIFLK